MARKTETIVIEREGRDFGKHFLLTEMAAMKAEKWATRALLAIGQSGADLGDEIMTAGFSGMVALGLRAVLTVPFPDAEPLLDEMMECVQFIPDPSKPNVVRRMIADDVEEIATVARLRDAVIELHTGFSIAAVLSTLGAVAKVKEAGEVSNDTPMFPKPAEP